MPEPQSDPILETLLSRGQRARRSISLSDGEALDLVERIVRDFNDAVGGCSQWYKNQVELVKNWEGIVDPKTFPYEDAANVRVPFTSVQVEQWVARLVKALLGGDRITLFERLDETIDQGALQEMNQWFQWEMEEITDLYQALEEVIRQAAIGGFAVPTPRWHKDRRELYETREFEFDQERPIEDQLQTALGMVFDQKEIVDMQPGAPGIYKLKVKDPDEPQPDPARVTFSIYNGRLCADVVKIETVFNGVKIDNPNKEDIVLINTNPDLEKLPFEGWRIWLDIPSYRNGMASGEWDDLGDELNTRVIATATAKVPEIVPLDYTELQDAEEGTSSTDPAASAFERRFIEVYRWEGWIPRERDLDVTTGSAEAALAPAIQVAVWCVPRARQIIRIERLEALNKDAGRSMIKFGFIQRPGRTFDIGLAEWLRHVQAELDGVHNLRIDSATLVVMPFGFYKPLAGMSKDIMDMKPGKLYPSADPASVNFPRTNANPQWSYNDEALIKKYGGEQAGLGETGTGGFVSKRQSASEYLGQANAIDLRTELVVKGFLRSTRKLLYRILGLYQQFAPSTRIYQVAGEDGLRTVKRFKTDRLNGKLLLRLTGNIDQINPQLQRDVAVNMLSLLMNQIMIQLGIVKPDTIYAAIKLVAKTMNYKDVPLHQPDVPEESPPPDVENRLMFEGQPVEPHLGENYNLHLMKHQQYLIDPDSPKTPQAIQAVLEHIQKTQKMMQVDQFLRQQQAAQAVQASQMMQTMGIRPGLAGGQQPGQQAQPGTQDEGVQGQTAEAA